MAPHTDAKNVVPQTIAYLDLIGNTALRVKKLPSEIHHCTNDYLGKCY